MRQVDALLLQETNRGADLGEFKLEITVCRLQHCGCCSTRGHCFARTGSTVLLRSEWLCSFSLQTDPEPHWLQLHNEGVQNILWCFNKTSCSSWRISKFFLKCREAPRLTELCGRLYLRSETFKCLAVIIKMCCFCVNIRDREGGWCSLSAIG